MGKSVWVIEKGSYSDHRVVGVYSTQERAKLVCEHINKDGSYEPATVAKWPLDPGVEAINKGLLVFTVWMLRDGTVEKCDQGTGGFEYALSAAPHIWRRSKAPAYRGKNAVDCLTAQVFARNIAHAVKIVNEYRTQIIAKGEWDE